MVPARGTLGIGETMQVTVKYQPLTTGDHDVPLVVRYSTGERWALHGARDSSPPSFPVVPATSILSPDVPPLFQLYPKEK